MNALFEFVDSHVPLGVIVLAGDERVRYINQRMSLWLGSGPMDWVGSHLTDVVTFTSPIACPLGVESSTAGAPHLLPVIDRQFSTSNVIEAVIGGLRHTCISCFPITWLDEEDCWALLFLNASNPTAVHAGFAATVMWLQQTQTSQHELLEKLEQTNQHLVRSEKLAGIGQLAAGVAHEINNPIGYVFSNLRTMAGYLEDMMRIIDAADYVSAVDELHAIKSTVDYEYIKNDIGALIKESEEGINRVRNIISALKDFSHHDEEGFRAADVHRAIDTALNVINNEIKYRAEVKKYYGDLPMVECNVSQISQVVMNLLINAVQSLNDFGVITVRTGHSESWVWFEIQDTGQGIDTAVKERIFEPFFTTKAQGEGTGLGLSVSDSIVRRHGGRIAVRSSAGDGTVMRVWLPVEQPIPSADHELA